MASIPSTSADSRPVLTLAELEAFDPHPTVRGVRQRFCCPLPACGGKPIDREHQSFSVNVETGGWCCFRCGAKGQLQEHWTQQRDVRRAALGRAFSLPSTESRPAATDWRTHVEGAVPLAGSPGEAYVNQRGIPTELATVCGVQFHPAWFGYPAVLFFQRDREGQTVAASGRYLQDRKPKTLTAGTAKQGAFWTPGALKGDQVVIVEGAFDALSLAVCGVPALALVGLVVPDWLPAVCVLKRVLVALDADAAGDQASASITEQLRSFGARVERWRPSAGKDWNEALAELGRAALAAELGAAVPAIDSKLLEDLMVKTVAILLALDAGDAGPAEGLGGEYLILRQPLTECGAYPPAERGVKAWWGSWPWDGAITEAEHAMVVDVDIRLYGYYKPERGY